MCGPGSITADGRCASRWVAALRDVQEMAEDDLPTRSPRGDGPPLPRAWAEKDPVAAKRLQLARAEMGVIAEQHGMPVENLLTPDYLRRTLWTPPRTREPGTLLDEIAAQLAAYGARSWQIALTAPILTTATLEADAAADAGAVAAADDVPPAESAED